MQVALNITKELTQEKNDLMLVLLITSLFAKLTHELFKEDENASKNESAN